MPSALVAERLEAAQFELKRACDLLLAPTPQALNSCQAALENAVFVMRALPPQTASQAVRAVRADVLRARQLLENLARFYRGWERLLGTMSGGYVAGGDPAPVFRTGRICCRG
jgi:hypothetical protein